MQVSSIAERRHKPVREGLVQFVNAARLDDFAVAPVLKARPGNGYDFPFLKARGIVADGFGEFRLPVAAFGFLLRHLGEGNSFVIECGGEGLSVDPVGSAADAEQKYISRIGGRTLKSSREYSVAKLSRSFQIE